MIYHLSWTTDQSARVYSAVNNDGNVVTELISEGKEIESGTVELVDNGGTVADFAHSISQELIVSERLLQLLKDYRVCPEIQEIPISVKRDGIILREDYWFLYPNRSFDVVDRDASDCELIGEYLFSVNKWVVSKKRLPELDLFYTNPRDWLLTDDLINALKAKKITGGSFDLIEVS